MKMSKMLMIAAILMVADRPALAEQGWADSPDFTVNAVPEPVAAALFVLGIRFAPIGYSLFVMRRRAKREMGKRHLGVLGLVMLGSLVDRCLAWNREFTCVVDQKSAEWEHS